MGERGGVEGAEWVKNRESIWLILGYFYVRQKCHVAGVNSYVRIYPGCVGEIITKYFFQYKIEK
jgi:hypothetical protein